MSFMTDGAASLPPTKPDRYWHGLPGDDHDKLRAALLDLRTAVLALGGGPGGSLNVGSATVDFGAGGHSASVAVTGQTAITGTSTVCAWLAAEASADHNAEEHALVAAYAAIAPGDLVAGTGFTVHARSSITLSGAFTVRWLWA